MSLKFLHVKIALFNLVTKGCKVMSKSTRNSGNAWTPTEVKQLQKLADQNTPTRVIGLKLGRTEGAIYTKSSAEGISLSPTNQSPYGTKK
jgi:hypothetical protein